MIILPNHNWWNDFHRLLNIQTGLKEENFDKVRIDDVHSLSKAEAL